MGVHRSPGLLRIPKEVVSNAVSTVARVFGFPLIGAVKDAAKPYTLPPEAKLVTEQPVALTDLAAEIYSAGAGPTGHGSAT